MGHKCLTPTLRIALNTKDYPYRQITLAKHILKVGAKGIDVDTASAFFIAGLEPGDYDIKAARALNYLKCKLTDPATGSAISGPGGVRLTVVVSLSWHHTPRNGKQPVHALPCQ